ncbi:MAG: DMT family transporter [Rhizobiaceae bacterium]|nr:DMT family transporter [Rhizobiaceae bacterium]
MSVATDVRRLDAIDGLAAATMVLLTLSWGLNGVLVKLSNVGFNPVLVTAGRSALAALAVFLWCHWRGVKLWERDGTLPAGLLAGALFGAEFVLIFFAYDHTTVARGSIIMNTMPFMVLVAGHFLLGEPLSMRKLGGLTVAFVGLILVFSDKLSLPSADALKGDLMMLVAAAIWAATTIVVKKSKLSRVSAEKTLLYQLVVSTVFALPLIPLGGPLLREVGWLAISSFFVQAIYVVAFTYLLWFWLMRQYPASGLSSFAVLSPVFGVLGGAVFLGEPLTWRIFAALVLIAIGLYVVNRPGRPQPEEAGHA